MFDTINNIVDIKKRDKDFKVSLPLNITLQQFLLICIIVNN